MRFSLKRRRILISAHSCGYSWIASSPRRTSGAARAHVESAFIQDNHIALSGTTFPDDALSFFCSLSLFFFFSSLLMFICLVSVHAGLACARSRSSRQDLRAVLMIRRRRNNYSSSAHVMMTTTTTTTTTTTMTSMLSSPVPLQFYMHMYISFRVIIPLSS